ncbi:hypothetical protein NDU88_006811 [Pleurodeles waltl]|uniref:Uncharacterized protein n=1 Tax=Pleurodeles waltl TaxID=8319 RepID=A0AAV7UM39_PLEWA|nr:hypothetical protein NDU88_006811 [Pleurodeles waltl]
MPREADADPPQPSSSTTGNHMVHSGGTAKGPVTQGPPIGEEHDVAYLAQSGPACRSGRRLPAMRSAGEPDGAHACRSGARLEDLNGYKHQTGVWTLT